MIRVLVLFGGAILLSANPLGAQAQGPRSSDYLFVSTAADSRALWLNPAGTQLGSQASLMGEVVLDRSIPDSARVAQLTFGLSTRAFSLGYQRDRLRNDSTNHTVRFGLATRFPRGAIGLATSFYSSTSTSRGWDIGLNYLLLPPLTLGMVLRNMGKPTIRSSRLPLTGALGVAWTEPTRRLTVTTEVLAADRIDESGYDLGYRAGTQLSLGSQLPFSAIFAIRLDNDFRVGAWTVGISVGGDRQALAMGTVGRTDGTSDLDTVSLTGVALNQTGR